MDSHVQRTPLSSRPPTQEEGLQAQTIVRLEMWVRSYVVRWRAGYFKKYSSPCRNFWELQLWSNYCVESKNLAEWIGLSILVVRFAKIMSDETT